MARILTSPMVDRPGTALGAPAPFLSDVVRAQLQRQLLGPSLDEYRSAQQAYRSSPSAVVPDSYIEELMLSGQVRPQNLSLSGQELGQVYTTSYVADPETGDLRQTTGWFYPWEVRDAQGDYVYDESSPEWQRAADLYAQNTAAKRLFEQQQRMERGRAGEVSRTANELAARMVEAGAQFAPGALNDANIRQFIYDRRDNVPSILRQGGNFVQMGPGRAAWKQGYTPEQLRSMGIELATESQLNQGGMAPGVTASTLLLPGGNGSGVNITRTSAGTTTAPVAGGGFVDSGPRPSFSARFASGDADGFTYHPKMVSSPTPLTSRLGQPAYQRMGFGPRPAVPLLRGTIKYL